ncbi:MAG: 2-phosphosulfolactate phosphatase [OCS116 cluster bacterium]|uniref:Probable 2-phosphosulfolactate phosphatase n=1 Tax=OCS116 cluster bacterium TaxID=2030921 RepID=A0A2A4YV90_9PROT|nr:2-phosphosulfolactate phosphatase [OCS116 cluster bacterium]
MNAKIHVEWGARALDAKADIMVIVDCLSFSTATTVATAKGARVYPFSLKDEAIDFAVALNVPCANKRSLGGLSLSPPTLAVLGKADAIILPSPNGSHLTLFADAPIVIAGCLRNAKAVADFINISGVRNVQFVAAGERWQDGGLRPAFEDWIACGAMIHLLNGILTAEAGAAAASFRWAEPDLQKMLKNCLSGQELCAQGFEQDVQWASELSLERHVPMLRGLDACYADFGVADERLKPLSVKYYEV